MTHLQRAALALILISALPACARHASPTASGESVTQLDHRIWIVFQASDNAYWFGSNGQGVYRWDGTTLVRFTQEHGLGGNHVRGIQEDRAGKIYVNSDPGGVSRFDGRSFSTLPIAAPSRNGWTLRPDDLWFPGGQDSGVVYRHDGTSLHRLAFPNTKRGDEFMGMYPRAKFPNMKYNPYDVYTVFKDSRGDLWFGTAVLGACRFNGESFAWIDKAALDFDTGDASFGVRSIIEDTAGKFWLSNTLNRFVVCPTPVVHQTERAAVALNYVKEPGISDLSAPCALFMSSVRDKNGDLLFATLGSGVWRYDGVHMTNYPVTHDGFNIPVYSIYRDRQDTLWLGTQEHGVYKFNGETFERLRL